MTFGISTWAAWLLIGLAAAGALTAFLVRPRPRGYVVPSLVVWQQVLGDPHERTLWERIRWMVSALLTVLIAVTIAAAMARPAPRATDRSAARTLLILDSSWTMRARLPGGGTRWDSAVQQARALARASAAHDIAIATTGEGVVEGPTGDPARIDRALTRLTPSGGPDGPWPQIVDADAVHFFTDGAAARPARPDLTMHSVFVAAPNVAVTAFEVERAPADSGAHVVLSVANFASERQVVHLTLTRGAAALIDQSITIDPQDSYRTVVPVPVEGDPRFHAHVSAPGNALDVDDDAGAWLWTAAPLRIGVVGTKSPVAGLLAHDPTLKVSSIDPAGYAQASADVWVFDRWMPASPPAQPALMLDPPTSTWLGTRGTAESQPTWRAGTPHPILQGVDVSLGRLGPARAVVRPTLETIAASDRNTPLVSIEDGTRGRYVILDFSVQDVSFASTTAYPILLGNAVDWLGRPDLGARHQPGRVILAPSTRRVVSPGGQALPLATLDDHVSVVLPTPGLYLTETGTGQDVIRVGLDDPARSNLQSSSVGEAHTAAAPSGSAQRPWWVSCAAAALALAALEWVTWRRRVTV